MAVMAPKKRRKATGWAKRIQTLKAKRGTTWEALADQLGISVETVRAWAYGKRANPSQLALRAVEQLEQAPI